MHLIIAAALAVAAALAEFTIVPYLRIGEATPHLVLVLGVVGAIAGSFEVGMVFAFVGGLALDVIGQRPLGSSAFALLIAIGVASVIGGLFGRAKIAAPIFATLVVSPLYAMTLLAVTTALTTAPLPGSSLEAVLPSAVYDAVLAAIVGPLAVAVAIRRRDSERVDW